MKRVLLEGGIIVLLVLIGISVFVPSGGSDINNVIADFENSVDIASRFSLRLFSKKFRDVANGAVITNTPSFTLNITLRARALYRTFTSPNSLSQNESVGIFRKSLIKNFYCLLPTLVCFSEWLQKYGYFFLLPMF